MMKETWTAKIKEIRSKIEELIPSSLFSSVSAWSKKLQNFAVTHVDLTCDLHLGLARNIIALSPVPVPPTENCRAIVVKTSEQPRANLGHDVSYMG